ncbi:MOSC domain-containing protein [Marinovum sp.]|uniref:MOSC domain-containing protein n=1 Tax=Marinovum sp. TaxID=2024839 RepID=UPI002B26FC83|nr:MOSC domain-containing protein [Marinovum sp.]
MTDFTITELRIGKVAPLGPRGVASAIDKRSVPGPIMARTTSLDGDEQGDPRHHGGADKALHAYPASHYISWSEDLPEREDRFRPGAFGENLVIEGATEPELCLFDRYQIGGATVEVSQTRQPCWKLNLRFDQLDMARRVQETGRTGWYFRVLSDGLISPGDRAELITRPQPDWPLSRVWRLLYRDTLDPDALADFANLPCLPESWQRAIDTRLARQTVEDWRPRLDTPE